MITLHRSHTQHDFEKTNLVTQKGGFDIFQCKKCKIKGKSYNMTHVVVKESYSKDKIHFCTNEYKGIPIGTTIILNTDINGNDVFVNLKCGTKHQTVAPPKNEDLNSTWVLGVGEAVRIFPNEFEIKEDMILNFLTKFGNRQPTYFPEKILNNCLLTDYLNVKNIYNNKSFFTLFAAHNYEFTSRIFTGFFNPNPKIHTIRADKKNRWKAGNEIQFVINQRTKKQFQFAAGKCTSVQKIEIIHPDIAPLSTISKIIVLIDDKPQTQGEKHMLAINDGFESLEDFFSYFDRDFKGKIIHWTDLKY